MKSISYCFTLFFVVGYCLSSCSSEEDIINPSINKHNQTSLTQTKALTEESEIFTYTIIYHDKEYKTLCESRNDSLFILDEDIDNLQKQIFANPNSASLVLSDDVVEYFDSQEDFLNKYGIRDLTKAEEEKVRLRPQTRDPQYNSIAYAVLFDDTKFRDTRYEMDISDPDQDFTIKRLKDYGMNDKTSSIKVQYTLNDENYCAILTVWEDADFNFGDNDKTKHRTNFIATWRHAKQEWGNLKHIYCLNAHDSWNDRISSCAFRIGAVGSAPPAY